MNIIAINDDDTLTFASIEEAMRFFDDCTYPRIHFALEHGSPLFKDGEKFFLDEELEYEPERDS